MRAVCHAGSVHRDGGQGCMGTIHFTHRQPAALPAPHAPPPCSHDCSSGVLLAVAAVKLAASDEHFHSCTLLGMTCRVLFRYGLGHMPRVPPCGQAGTTRRAACWVLRFTWQRCRSRCAMGVH